MHPEMIATLRTRQSGLGAYDALAGTGSYVKLFVFLCRNVSDVVAAHTADFDGDGDLDILTISEGTNTTCRTLAVHWCRFVHGQVTVGEQHNCQCAWEK